MTGIKRSNWEGGVRVPLFWYWKDKIKPGTVNTQMVSNYDMLYTIAEIIGEKQIKSKDGISYAKTLLGGRSKERDYTVYSSFLGPALVTKDGWKLRYFKEKDLYQLYYHPDDYKEEHDILERYPKKTSRQIIKLIILGNTWNTGIIAFWNKS